VPCAHSARPSAPGRGLLRRRGCRRRSGRWSAWPHRMLFRSACPQPAGRPVIQRRRLSGQGCRFRGQVRAALLPGWCVAELARICEEVCVRSRPAIQAAVCLVGPFGVAALRACVPDLLTAHQITNRPADCRASQAGHRADPQGAIHGGERTGANAFLRAATARQGCPYGVQPTATHRKPAVNWSLRSCRYERH
jgi:hypothetical protein